jgi:hypothetical protein
MQKRMKTFLASVGSVVAVYPATSYSDFVPKASPSERMREHWEKTGDQLRSAITEYEGQNGQQKKELKQPRCS